MLPSRGGNWTVDAHNGFSGSTLQIAPPHTHTTRLRRVTTFGGKYIHSFQGRRSAQLLPSVSQLLSGLHDASQQGH